MNRQSNEQNTVLETLAEGTMKDWCGGMVCESETVVIAVKAMQTPMELIESYQALQTAALEVLEVLIKDCGECDDCSLCETKCLEPPVAIPSSIIEEAGIAPGCKLEAEAVGDGNILIYPAGHAYDIHDVPDHLVSALRVAGLCISDLDDLLRENASVCLLERLSLEQDEGGFYPEEECLSCGMMCEQCRGDA